MFIVEVHLPIALPPPKANHNIPSVASSKPVPYNPFLVFLCGVQYHPVLSPSSSLFLWSLLQSIYSCACPFQRVFIQRPIEARLLIPHRIRHLTSETTRFGPRIYSTLFKSATSNLQYPAYLAPVPPPPLFHMSS